jgi:hypothetical protein
MTDKRYRVAHWGTGHSGMPALRALIEHPTFELVVSEQPAERRIPKGRRRTTNLACAPALREVTEPRRTREAAIARPTGVSAS